MNNSFEFTKQLAQIHHENVSKFVYFIFSITTVSIGFAISTTQSITPTYWLILWVFSILSMCASLYCGVIYIIQNNVSIRHASNLLQCNEIIEDLKETNNIDLGSHVFKICSGQVKVLSMKDAIIHSIVLILKNKAEAIGENIIEIELGIVRERISIEIAKFFGYESVIDAYTKYIQADKKAGKYVLWQKIALALGVMFYFFWHLSRIIFLNH